MHNNNMWVFLYEHNCITEPDDVHFAFHNIPNPEGALRTIPGKSKKYDLVNIWTNFGAFVIVFDKNNSNCREVYWILLKTLISWHMKIYRIWQ